MVERRSKNIQKRVTELSISLSSFACPRRLCFCLFELFVLFEPSGNSEQCASEADPFIRAVGIIAHAICTYTTLSCFSSILSTLLSLSFPLPLPTTQPPPTHFRFSGATLFFHPARVRRRLHSKRCCLGGTFNRYQMINETLVENTREKYVPSNSCCVYVLWWYLRRVGRLRNKIV